MTKATELRELNDAELVQKLRLERRTWLAQFPGLDPVIPRAVES